MEHADGIIEFDHPIAIEVGFTRDLFSGYLWLKDNAIWISAICSLHERKGNLSRLFDQINELGYTVKVPIPLPKMQSILKKKGFTLLSENHDITVWLISPQIK